MRVIRPGADNAEALAWLENALGYARNQGQKRLENLLKAVRTEVLFEIRLTAGAFGDQPLADGEIAKG